MAKPTLPVNYKDDILASSMSGKRRYRMINNTDGTVSFEDATTYTQVGSDFGAANMNATNSSINAAADASKIIDNVDDISALTQSGYMMGGLAGKKLISDLDGCSFDVKEDGAYITYTLPGGADPVSKKLGSADIIYFGSSSKENAADVLSYAFSSNMESCIAIINYCRDVAVNPKISISAPNRQISDTSTRFSGYNVYNRTMVYLLNNVVPGQRITVGDYGGKILTLLKVSN